MTGANVKHSFKIFTWNARALFHHDIARRRKLKLQFLRKITKTADVILIQESHGEEGEAERQLLLEMQNFTIFHSTGPKKDVGGIITMIRNDIIIGSATPVVTHLEPGRIHAITITHGDNTIHYINVHNHNISDAGINKTRSFMNTHASSTSISGGSQAI